MLKKLVFLLVLIIFAKPVYDWAMELTTEEAVVVEEAMSIEKPSITVEPKAQLQTDEISNTVTSPQQLAVVFRHYFNQWETDFTIYYKGSTANLEKLLEQAVQKATEQNTYLAGHLATREIQYEYTKSAATIHVKQSYLTNSQQEQIVDAVVQQILQDKAVHTMSDYEKVKFVNDYIVQNTVYSEQTTASPHSAYAVAYEGKGVCQGYALFAQKLLTELGIESYYVTGEVYTGGHAWNLVEIDGEWYHLDTTWNDPVPDKGTGITYKYFLANDLMMKKDHTWDTIQYPKATSTKYQFMHVMKDIHEIDGYIYFSHLQDENKLYQFNKQTGQEKRIGNVRALYIVGDGNWLYFSNYSNGAYLTKMRYDGSEQHVIYREEDAKDLALADGFVYFTVNNTRKKISLTGQ